MDLAGLTLTVTHDCNFSCSYCYKRKSKKYMKFSTAKQACAFFLPYLRNDFSLNFYGGEPLLALDLIKDTISFVDERIAGSGKKPKYSMTTNGSLLSEEVIRFLNDKRFSIEFSFDGLNQDSHRNPGSFESLVSILKQLLRCPDIELEVNSVFTPEGVPYLSRSTKFLMDLGVPQVRVCFSYIESWSKVCIQRLEKEFLLLKDEVLRHYENTGRIPLVNFTEKREKRISYCSAGKDRLAVDPDEGVWGCCIFPDYFERKHDFSGSEAYFFGPLKEFKKNFKIVYPRILKNYSFFSMDNYSTPKRDCFMCVNVESCSICPLNAAFPGNPLGTIPAHACEILKVRVKARERFWEECNIV